MKRLALRLDETESIIFLYEEQRILDTCYVRMNISDIKDSCDLLTTISRYEHTIINTLKLKDVIYEHTDLYTILNTMERYVDGIVNPM